MAVEIERKFLVVGESWRDQAATVEPMIQGYLAGPPAALCSVRVRIAGDNAFLNIKSLASGISRDEYEYAIPAGDARHMLATLAGAVVEKRRHHVEVHGHTFEIDEFGGASTGLIIAELELDAVDASYPRPAWLGREVSALARYYNLNLAVRPFALWNADERDATDVT